METLAGWIMCVLCWHAKIHRGAMRSKILLKNHHHFRNIVPVVIVYTIKVEDDTRHTFFIYVHYQVCYSLLNFHCWFEKMKPYWEPSTIEESFKLVHVYILPFFQLCKHQITNFAFRCRIQKISISIECDNNCCASIRIIFLSHMSLFQIS